MRSIRQYAITAIAQALLLWLILQVLAVYNETVFNLLVTFIYVAAAIIAIGDLIWLIHRPKDYFTAIKGNPADYCGIAMCYMVTASGVLSGQHMTAASLGLSWCAVLIATVVTVFSVHRLYTQATRRQKKEV